MTTKFIFFVFFLVFFQFVVSDKAEIETQENQENALSLDSLLEAENETDANLLKYHGGAILDFPISLHYIWYGPWSPQDQEVIIATFVGNNIDTSEWYRVTVCYTDAVGNTVTDSIDVSDSYFMNSKTFGLEIDQDLYQTVIQSAIASGSIFQDPDDIYVLWTHDTINVPSLCDDYCGYHSYFNTSAGSLKYIVVGSGGNAMMCDGCASNNGPWDPVTNQIVNSFAHELIETVSNPIPWTGYYDPMNRQNGDKCANQFIRLTPFRSDPSRQWNVVIGIEDPHWFLIQANWDIVTQNCTLYPSKKNCYLYGGQKPIFSDIHTPETSGSSGIMTHVNVYQLFAILLVCIVNVFLF